MNSTAVSKPIRCTACAVRSRHPIRKCLSNADAFAADLRLVRESLMEHRGERLAILFLDPLLRQVQTFAFTCTPSTFGSMPKSTRRLSRSCPEPAPLQNDPPYSNGAFDRYP